LSFDPNFIFLDLIIGGVGMVLFIYGKKQQRWPQMSAGIALMVYPYFVSSVAMLAIVGAAIGAALWWAVWYGY